VAVKVLRVNASYSLGSAIRHGEDADIHSDDVPDLIAGPQDNLG
jgi:hypothetical protein